MSDIRYNSFIKKISLITFKVFVLSMLISSCSDKGDIEYQPVGKTLTNKQLGKNITLAISDFPDKTSIKGFLTVRSSTKPENNLVGFFRGGYRIPIRKLYSNRAISLDVIEALKNLFKANGYDVIRYYGNSDIPSLSDERLAIKGRINEFMLIGYPEGMGTPPSIDALIDIDLRIIDTKYQRTIWTGKIENYKEIGPNRGIFTDANKIFLFFNRVFSDAIEIAWIDYGMLSALKSLDKSFDTNMNIRGVLDRK